MEKLKTALQYDFTEIGLEVGTLGVLEINNDGKIYLCFNNVQELIIHKNVYSFLNIQNFFETLKKISMPFEISLKNVENRTFNCDNLESVEIVCDKFNETIDNQILSLVRGIKRILTNYKFKVIIKNAPKSLMWKIDNRCQHCGGQFKTTIFFTEKCKNCGKKRDC